MNITDRPGRFYALLILSPGLFICGIYNKKNIYIFLFLILNGLLLFIYELFWILFKNDETTL